MRGNSLRLAVLLGLALPMVGCAALYGGETGQPTHVSPESGSDQPVRPDAYRGEEPIPAKVSRYAERLIRQGDLDGDEKLNRLEWVAAWGFLTTDADLDGQVSLDELVTRIARYGRHRRIRLMAPLVVEDDEPFTPLLDPSDDDGPPTSPNGSALEDVDGQASDEEPPRRDTRFVVSPSRKRMGLPSWFDALDTDGDGQLTMAEFSPKPTGASQAEFARLDLDGDGVITPAEYLRAVRSSGSGDDR